MKKLNLGCGSWLLPGYINCDLYNPDADIKCDARELPFDTDSIDEIYTSHLVEHFDHLEAWTVLREWIRVLKPGGTLILETPDLYTSCKEFARLYEMGDQAGCINLYSHFFSEPWTSPGQIHKFIYTPIQLRWTLEQLNMRNIRQEPALRYTGREHICMKFLCEKPHGLNSNSNV
jgi:SAM-dependent methyltransferase